MKERLLYHDLMRYLDHKNALVVTGMRQVGKTTLLRQVYEQVQHPKLWFDFENPLDTLYFEDNDYRAIYHILKEKAKAGEGERLFVFIDEIQYLPEITRIMKYHIDHFGVKYLVTGSSYFYLKNLFPESLSGRKFLFPLHPLSFREVRYFHGLITEREALKPFEPEKEFNYRMVSYKELRPLYDSYLEFGGFPEVVTTRDTETKRMVLKNIFSSFFEKDLQLLSDLQDIRELRDMIRLLVPRTGNLIDVTRISSELGTHRVKIYQFFEFLQASFFIRLLPKFTHSIDRSVAGGRKIYFTDTGLLNTIGKVNEGQLFETAVGNQLAALGELSFYNRRNTAEIDFILDREIAFEVKLTTTPRDLEQLKKVCLQAGIEKYCLISLNHVTTENTLFPMYI